MLLQLVPRENDSLILNHVAKKGKLFSGKTDFLACAEDFAGVQMHLQIGQLPNGFWSFRGLSQQYADPGGKFLVGERF